MGIAASEALNIHQNLVAFLALQTFDPMPLDRNDLRRAVHTLLNDVVEQCFHHLIHHPHDADHINELISEASDEINYQCLKIDAHNLRSGSRELADHYTQISKATNKKSLEMLSRLQKIQRNGVISGGDARPEGFSSPSQSF